MSPAPLLPARRSRRASTALLLVVPVLTGLLATSAPAGAGEQPASLVAARDDVGGEGLARHASPLAVTGRVKHKTPPADPTGFTPEQVRKHLGLTGKGKGQTIAIVTAYDAPNVVADLAEFNRTFNLPAPPWFRVVNQSGGSKLPPVKGHWALETALDVQWAHAVAPEAGILLVEATSSAMGDLLAAVSWAASQPEVTVISGSWGTPEFSGQGAQDDRCRLTTAVCVFASGDDGGQATYPATMPHALAVGGTNLTFDANGSPSETAWSGSGGGISLYSPRPAFQKAVNTGTRRAAPDVSYAAGEPAGFPVYSTTPVDKQTGWFQLSGTSAGAPQWAGILAVGNELRSANRKGPLTAVDAVGRTPLHTALYSATSGLLDIDSGTNGTCGLVCSAGIGYDTVTGLGSPAHGLELVLGSAP